MLDKSFFEWSRETLASGGADARAAIAADWLRETAAADPAARYDEATAQKLHTLFKEYLRQAKTERFALSTLPPEIGRAHV